MKLLIAAASTALAAASLLALLSPAVANAQGLRTLAGTELIVNEGIAGTSSEVHGTCNPTGDSTYTFTVSGLAFGPYAGTFTESGTFTLGPFTQQPDGNLVATPLSFDATFTIVSSPFVVSGTKTLAATPLVPYNFGGCGEALFSGAPDAVQIQINTDYAAAITVGGATFVDRGTTIIDYADLGLRAQPFGTFQYVQRATVSDCPIPVPLQSPREACLST